MNLSTADLRNYWTEFHETWWSYRYMFLVGTVQIYLAWFFPYLKMLLKIKSYSTWKIKVHIPKTDKAVKSEIKFDIPMITDLVYTFQMIC
jgi:hypothetical protein